MIAAYLSIFTIIPLLFYLADGYYEKNVWKGFQYILWFIFLSGFAVYMVKIFGLLFILFCPLFIIILLIINHIKYGK